VTVSYLAIIPAGGETQWGNDGSGEPQGYICDHPTPADEFSHKAMTRRSVRFSLEEVAR
jgi:hypothetical protein